MAIVEPTFISIGGAQGVPAVKWSSVTSTDTAAPFLVKKQHGFVGCVQITGVSPGAVASIQQSNDGVNWFPVFDPTGAAVEAQDDAMFELSLAAAYLKPETDAGSIDVILLLRG